VEKEKPLEFPFHTNLEVPEEKVGWLALNRRKDYYGGLEGKGIFPFAHRREYSQMREHRGQRD